MILGEAGLEGRTLECLLRTMLLERSEHANSDMAAGVVTWRRDNFSGLVDDQCRYYLGKFRPQEVPWVPGGSGPSTSCPYSPECVEGKFCELRQTEFYEVRV